MFQKIAKHRANDASNDVHRPPLFQPNLVRLVEILEFNSVIMFVVEEKAA